MQNAGLHGWVLMPGGEPPEISRIRQGALAHGVALEVLAPKSVQVLLAPDRPTEVWVDGEARPLPQFAIAGFVDEADDYNLALMRQLDTQGAVCINL